MTIAIQHKHRTETRAIQILRYIGEYVRVHHNAPSTRNIAFHLGIKQQTAYGYMMKMLSRGQLERIDGEWKIPQAEYHPNLD